MASESLTRGLKGGLRSLFVRSCASPAPASAPTSEDALEASGSIPALSLFGYLLWILYFFQDDQEPAETR